MDMATNLKKLKFLDVTLDQTKGIFRSYEKPNNAFFMSATHPTLFRTSSREVMPQRLFNSVKVECEDVLEMNNHKASLKYTARNTPKSNKNRQPPIHQKCQNKCSNIFFCLLDQPFLET